MLQEDQYSYKSSRYSRAKSENRYLKDVEKKKVEAYNSLFKPDARGSKRFEPSDVQALQYMQS
jgi:hypothetical protein